ncbi:hypothetical protein NSK_008095 [Nannochloropsis salina CCMP1776]|uniref:HMA domain-containing protein n=1 Tax=Nannochloropsis salina CCMP1776 TaxID=1027361 RepID=A0A4D9CVH0_9STRA|nr:copper chaperone [Nannochloropsis gaditana CCMP526]EKU22660.1 copper chaperone [Nannochloropsis gaditana CCMP526]TFJ80669.1 hypothetical protein NSK_008095 [Nannochloropsis salina CCMP1776]|eukprot:TFJ80669.1 hypothetical protein NSK_008095 [Nannochloropsis salina CCMP1776]
MSAPKTTTFHVGMTCDGCANAVKRILGKMEGVTAIDTNVPEKKVVVQTEDHVQATDLLTALAKWGEAAGKEVKMLA